MVHPAGCPWYVNYMLVSQVCANPVGETGLTSAIQGCTANSQCTQVCASSVLGIPPYGCSGVYTKGGGRCGIASIDWSLLHVANNGHPPVDAFFKRYVVTTPRDIYTERCTLATKTGYSIAKCAGFNVQPGSKQGSSCPQFEDSTTCWAWAIHPSGAASGWIIVGTAGPQANPCSGGTFHVALTPDVLACGECALS